MHTTKQYTNTHQDSNDNFYNTKLTGRIIVDNGFAQAIEGESMSGG